VKLHEAVAIALAGLALSLLAAPSAQAAGSEFFGVVQGPALDDTDLDSVGASGVNTTRFLLSWKSVEKHRGERNWHAVDRVVGGLASRGVRPLPVVWGSPPWTRAGGSARPPVNSSTARSGWQNFLKVAVARYGRGGRYWTDEYPQQFGAAAAPLPITAWQVWNEPNLRPEFDPGETVAHAAQQYGQLVRISHDAIKSKDGLATIVLAGVATQKDPHAFEFLGDLYSVPGIESDFDVVAQHPYAPGVDAMRNAIERVRAVMANHGDKGTPLWLTEFGWGSAPADGSGINVGPTAQAQMLTRSVNLILSHRSAWNLQRVYWFDWRDPPPGSHYVDICIRCGSAGLLAHDRAPKPAYAAFRAFSADVLPPTAKINFGPLQGGTTSDPTPTLKFVSSEAGSTFRCRFDAKPLASCSSPFTPKAALAKGPHVFSVRAADAAGNESAPATRAFTVLPH
jgi:hypothetical protein